MSSSETINSATSKAMRGGWQPKGVNTYTGMIFNHAFAQALWGNDAVWTGLCETNDDGQCTEHIYLPAWAFHLARMSLTDDPIKYLAENM